MGTTGQSITLANSIIGVGILAMPFCFQQCGVLLATVILLSMGLVSRLCCYFLLKSALIARRRNFEFLAFHVFGPAGKLAVELGIIGFLMGTCIAYFVVVGELGPQIISKLFNINQSDILRTSIMVIVSLVCVLPLGLLRNVDSLSNVSAATIGFYFCLVIKVITEAASQLLSGEWHTRMEMWKPSGFLQCVPIFSMALFCQTQLFEIFESMPTLSLEKMNVVTKNAINICTGVYFTLGLFGYIAFCSQNISGNILMSLSPTMASDVIKLGFVMSLAFSFPLIIFPCRASLYSFLYRKVHPSHHDHIINHSIPETTFRCITVAIIAVALFISLLIPNIELVLGLVGSTIGVLICVVFPAACFVNVTFKNTNERILAKAVLVLGLFIMVLGTFANLQAAENAVDRYDDKIITQERIDKIVEDFFKMEKPGVVKIKPQNEEIPHKEENIVHEIQDSEIQPPNPVPPESQSNEKNQVIIESDKEEKKIKETDKLISVDAADKVSESHPKNLKTKLNGIKSSNGNEIIEQKNADQVKEMQEKPIIEKEKLEPQIEQEIMQEKEDKIKEQKLIETIKQHGEEQKELIKEQKEILSEIIKTKNEMKQNKEVDSSEAKKIAVESIQKIANMAIQSLSGVSDKPVGNVVAVDQKLEKIANEAVQEIAKKAVETMEAIKEINEKQILPKHDDNNNLEIQKNIVLDSQPNKVDNSSLSSNKIVPVQRVPDQNNIKQNQNIQPNVGNLEPEIQNIKPNIPVRNLDTDNSQNIVKAPVKNINANFINAQPETVAQNNLVIANQQSVDSVQPNANVQPVVQNPNFAQIAPNNDKQQVPDANQHNPGRQENLLQNINLTQKNHSHAPEEPLSYKVGEDSVNNVADINLHRDIAQNVPLAMALNGNGNSQINNQPLKVIPENQNSAKLLTDVEKVNLNVQSDVNNVQNNGALKNNLVNNLEPKVENSIPVRQKREVVDCTKTTTLKPEDKEICKTLLGSPNIKEDSQEILHSKVDLNELVLPKNLPIDTMIHHMRSLKSVDEAGKER